jgi:energy-coupling factor transporter ATP-binding protein EcfA2
MPLYLSALCYLSPFFSHARALNPSLPSALSFAGHNGAGKSTTIAMMTGALAPTAGEATAYGHAITDTGSGAGALADEANCHAQIIMEYLNHDSFFTVNKKSCHA